MAHNPVELLWVSRSDFPQGQCIRPHAHEGFFHLFYGLEGGADFLVEEEPCRLEAGGLILVGVGRRHEMRRIERGRALLAELKFTVDQPQLCGALSFRPAFTPRAQAADGPIRSILAEAEGKRPYYRHYIQGALYALVALLARDGETVKEEEIAGFSRATLAALDYIDRNYAGAVLLEDVAGASGMNPNYVCTLFKRETGLSTNEYLNMVRVARAADLLQYGEMEVAQIAAQCGFTNASHFCRTFKRYAGLLPSQCRQLFYPSVVDMRRYGGDTFQATVPSEQLSQMLDTLHRLSRAQGKAKP